MSLLKIGFIGQGWIGKNYADNFESRGFSVIRYALEDEYVENKDRIAGCDIVFIAVPTPSTSNGFDYSIVNEMISLVGAGKIAIIKSTIIPGTTEKIQKKYQNRFIMHSPEFLREVTARHDADSPDRNVIGIPYDNKVFKEKAAQVMQILPKAPFQAICSSKAAELVKYGGNNFLFFKVLFINMLYDMSEHYDCDWGLVKQIVMADPRIGESHMNPVHKSGRGAGGHCFIKDFSAFAEMHRELNDKLGDEVLNALKNKNIDLLKKSNKDLDLLKGVYGDI